MREVILQNPDDWYDEKLLGRFRTKWGAKRFANKVKHYYLFFGWNLVIR